MKNKKVKRIFAIIMLVVLIGLILATLICAFAKVDSNILIALLYCDIVIPVFIWIIRWITGLIMNRNEENKA